MYLISLYFDEQTSQALQQYINLVAKKTGNTFMTDGKVPPHLTVSAMESTEEEKIVNGLRTLAGELKQGEVQLVSVGTFFPSVIFVSAVYSEYLHATAEMIEAYMCRVCNTKISTTYRPFHWVPHVTIGKKLSQEQMKIAFETLQHCFTTLDGRVVRIGLARTNPYRELMDVRLDEET